MTHPAVVFVDTETTGLDPDRHQIWEVAAIWHDPDGRQERTWQLPVALDMADPVALRIGKFYERRLPNAELTDCYDFAEQFEAITRGKHLCGAVISFDEERLRKLLRTFGACPGWHYHLIDVEAMAVGYLQGGDYACLSSPPWASHDLSRAVGVNPEQYDTHTALGDAEWALDLWAAMTGGRA